MEARPKIKLPLSQFDKTLEISGKCIIMLLWILTAVAFFKMPDTIPTHFSASGQADIYGNKENIFVLPVIGTILFIGLTVLNHYPQIYNYSDKITETNAAYQYSKATRMIRFLKLLIAILFTIIVLSTFLIAIHITSGLGSLFLPLTITLFCIPTVYAVMMVFNKK